MKYIFFLSLLFVSNLSNASNTYSFTSDWDQLIPSDLNMSSRVLDAPAGKHGHVHAQGDKLVFANGSEAKFWGIGLTFSKKRPFIFPPSKDESRKIVNKLSSLGFNHVRFIGFDNALTPLINHWKKHGDLNHELMDRFDFFVSELRKAGIYYSLSINNNSYLVLKGSKANFNTDVRQKFKQYKYVRLFDEDAIDTIQAWYKSFYGHVNQYTKDSYATDPANIYVSISNEDSLFSEYYGNFKQIDERAKKHLDKLFNKYLLSKYTNHKTIKNIWKTDLSIEENLELNNIKVFGSRDLKKFKYTRVRDTLDFLFELDKKLPTLIYSILNDLGYNGLTVPTNNWYGYAGLLSAANNGDYIEMHGYYDHPKSTRLVKRIFSVDNISYFDYILNNNQSNVTKNGTNLLPKIIMSSLVDRPLIISEWNHVWWSDYAYEGLLLNMVIASFQGYNALDAHTYFNHPAVDVFSAYPVESFTISGNPIWMVMNPTLSLAFLKGYIVESEITDTQVLANSYVDMLDIAKSKEFSNRLKKDPSLISRSLRTKVRTRLIGDKIKSWRKYKQGDIYSDTGQISLSDSRNPILRIETDKFLALAGFFTKREYDFNDVLIKVEKGYRGVVMMIALDDKKLSQSNNILVTVSSSFKRKDNTYIDVAGRRIVDNAGTGDVLVEKNPLYVRFKRKLANVEVSSINIKGERKDKGFYASDELVLIGDDEAPWYIFKY